MAFEPTMGSYPQSTTLMAFEPTMGSYLQSTTLMANKFRKHIEWCKIVKILEMKFESVVDT
jgi:hypothetical protein